MACSITTHSRHEVLKKADYLLWGRPLWLSAAATRFSEALFSPSGRFFNCHCFEEGLCISSRHEIPSAVLSFNSEGLILISSRLFVVTHFFEAFMFADLLEQMAPESCPEYHPREKKLSRGRGVWIYRDCQLVHLPICNIRRKVNKFEPCCLGLYPKIYRIKTVYTSRNK